MIEWQVVIVGIGERRARARAVGVRRIGAARDQRRRRAQEEERGRGDHQLAGGAAQAGGIVAAEEEHGVAVAGGERGRGDDGERRAVGREDDVGVDEPRREVVSTSVAAPSAVDEVTVAEAGSSATVKAALAVDEAGKPSRRRR